ncbi:MAG: prephenate dehydratase [Cyclobacteriaceae bacterium]|nr:prephenate dehydratase [Cyclobacteriaceae bacterium]MCH8517516.1 prephenate dehydratase [Cyclobacteriaceae bacterium]
MEKELKALRDKIDNIDEQLIDLLNQRLEQVVAVGRLKSKNNALVYRPERELEIISRLNTYNRGLLNSKAIEAIFLEIFAMSRNYELPQRVAYLGPEGSFTHQAAESRFGAMSDYIPMNSIASVFESVDTERVAFGVVPIENNQVGIVSETIDLLAERELTIAAEVMLPIHFTLAGLCEKISDIKRIYSKDVAFGQCKRFLDTSFNGRKIELIPVESTSKACRLAKEDDQSAALASAIAARSAQVPILFDNVEDSADNLTRFLILAKNFENQPSSNDRTTLLATVENKPGALAKLLSEVERLGINLTRIESRPAKKGKHFDYWFFIDADGHFREPKFQALIQNDRINLKTLGSYVKMES